jgi:hypothetical protein
MEGGAQSFGEKSLAVFLILIVVGLGFLAGNSLVYVMARSISN